MCLLDAKRIDGGEYFLRRTLSALRWIGQTADIQDVLGSGNKTKTLRLDLRLALPAAPLPP